MRWTRLSTTQRESLLAVALTVALQLEYLHRLSPLEAAAALLITVPLAVRLRWPLAVLAVVLAGIVIESALGGVAGVDFPVFPILSLVVALYAVGSRSSWTGLGVGAAMSLAGWSVASQLAHPRGNVVLGVLVTACGLLIGRAMAALRFESDVFDERTRTLERERDERAVLAVIEERRRIARELHDVIGHSISVMGVQAGAVRSVLRPDQQRERDALLAVERAGREAVVEMSRLIGLLRVDLGESGAPTPTLRRAEQLVAELCQAGLDARLQLGGEFDALPAGVDLAGFRILQEALTNVLKHAPQAQVDAVVTCTSEYLEIDVVDNGAGVRPPTGEPGHGLLGMRERSALYGGTLLTRARADGGFEVRARFPLQAG